MAIRIICGGNSASEIMPQIDERVIESVENSEQVSFLMDVKDGKPVFKRLRNDAEVSDFIAELNSNEEIARIEMDEKNRDIIIYLRELGEEPLEIEEIKTNCPEVISI